MSNKDADRYIQLFKALANEERIEIIRLLKKNKEMFAQDVERHFYLEQSTTSHHLNTLKRAGITKARKEGRKVFYSLDKESFEELWNSFSTMVLS
ncbi:MAG: helix-turn-helix transcriptional regulator [bacterium]|nr:helix-turn-helix transcriptional regulator [bacterium]